MTCTTRDYGLAIKKPEVNHDRAGVKGVGKGSSVDDGSSLFQIPRQTPSAFCRDFFLVHYCGD